MIKSHILAAGLGLLALLRPDPALSQPAAPERPGQPVAQIIHGESSIERYAAEELARYLNRVTGETLQITDAAITQWRPTQPWLNYPEAHAEATEYIAARREGREAEITVRGEEYPVRLDGPALVLGTPETLPLAAEALAALAENIAPDSDGFVVQASDDGRTLYFVARHPRGVLYAVYRFLEARAGVGFFEDGERVPPAPADALIPPFADNPPALTQVPAMPYRSQWIWTRYYGADRGHPINWGYDEWVSHLRWMAQRGFNSVLLYPVGYTRMWGDVHRRAFPETLEHDVEIWPEVEDFWGAHWSAQAGWGRSPEEQTRLMQRVLAFGREKLGLEFEYNFYLGNFEESLKKAYPEGTWIDWTNMPHHAYLGAAGRSPTLTFTDPRARELNQRFWKTFIETFGTDHKYWIAYREESPPDPTNPDDPDRGKSLADAVNAQREWMLEIDPQGDFFHWDWHGPPTWIGFDNWKKIEKGEMTFQDIPLEEIQRLASQYPDDLHEDIIMVSVLPPGAQDPLPCEYTNYYAPHPWVIGSLLGYAGQDVGLGGLYQPVDQFLGRWQKWIDADKEQGRLQGILHWNEIVQVNPLLDHLVAEAAWQGDVASSITVPDEAHPQVTDYYEARYGEQDAPVLRRAMAELYRENPQVAVDARLVFRLPLGTYTPEMDQQLGRLQQAVEQMLSVSESQHDNALYDRELVDAGRLVLHRFVWNHTLAAAQAAQNQDAPEFERRAEAARRSMSALVALVETDPWHHVGPVLRRLLEEPGSNRLVRDLILEHASGRLFDNYPLNDSAEFLRIVSAPTLDIYLERMQRHMQNPEGFPIAEAQAMHHEIFPLRDAFMEIPALEEEHAVSRARPAEILTRWMHPSE